MLDIIFITIFYKTNGFFRKKYVILEKNKIGTKNIF